MPRWWLSLGFVSLVALLAPAWPAAASEGSSEGSTALQADIDQRAGALHAKLVAWRRDFHQHPELSNREVRTAGVVAEHLRALGLEVETGVARTGVVTVRTTYNGLDVGVMHACGHDLHTAMLMGAAEVLTGLRAQIPGTVKFIFQPAEEGPPAGEDGGAPLMIKEGVLEKDGVAAIFGLHVFPFEVGTLAFRPQGLMAASDSYRIRVRGSQTHGALPWLGVDPIVVAAQIVLGLQTIVSRQSDLTRAPAVVTVGTFRGGTRTNIVPEEAVLEGTIRTFDPAMQDDIHARVTRTAQQIAASAGATAEVQIERGNPVTWNDPALTERMTPTLRRIASGPFLPNVQVTTTAEDFASYQKLVPGLFVFLGITPKGADPSTIHPNHSPRFYADEGALVPGVRTLASLAVDYLAGSASGRGPER